MGLILNPLVVLAMVVERNVAGLNRERRKGLHQVHVVALDCRGEALLVLEFKTMRLCQESDRG